MNGGQAGDENAMSPREFTRDDLQAPVTREFCPDCGTHIASRRPNLPMVILKVGTLNDLSIFKSPKLVIYVKDNQDFHVIHDGMP